MVATTSCASEVLALHLQYTRLSGTRRSAVLVVEGTLDVLARFCRTTNVIMVYVGTSLQLPALEPLVEPGLQAPQTEPGLLPAVTAGLAARLRGRGGEIACQAQDQAQ